jgi:hypothetical protein
MTPHEYREALLGLVEHLPEAEQAVVAAVLMGLADDEAAALYTAAKARKAELAAGDVAAALELGRAHGAAGKAVAALLAAGHTDAVPRAKVQAPEVLPPPPDVDPDAAAEVPDGR